MTKKIIILGTGGNSLDILDTLLDINDARGELEYECAGFLDDDASKWGQQIAGARVLGALNTASEYADSFFVNGIGSVTNFRRKREIISQTGLPRDRFESLVHPTARVSRTARLGRGVVIFQNVTVTNRVTIGDHVIVLPATVISHDDVIGAYTSIAGGVCVSGNVRVGEGCYLGSNATLKDGIKVGDLALIGMGSVVLNDVASGSVMAGNPARLLRMSGDDAGE
jgi:sugar O-acyltransferase (sialic acid O-acetyltransferase NeuD family)